MSLADVIHDTFYDIVGKTPSLDQMVDISSVIPKEILSIGVKWGWNDTVFRDNFYMWMSEAYK